MPQLHIWLLGPPRVDLDGVPCHLHSHKALALLAYLAMTNRPHSRTKLATLFWLGQNESRALAYLRHTLWTLRKAIGDDWFVYDGETISLASQPDLWLDVAAFTQQIASVRQLHNASSDEMSADLAALQRAVDLYRDDLLTGFALRDSPAFDDWLFFESEHLRQQLADALQRLVQGSSERGDYAAAIPSARRWLALDPLHEPAHQHLMQLYLWSGRRTAALRQYQECVRLLQTELSTVPSAETWQLYQAIKANRLPPPTTHLPATAYGATPVLAAPAPQPIMLRIATVLCAGFTELWEPMPDDLVATASRMTSLLEAFQPLLNAYGARVEQLLGDQFLAVFGVDQSLEDEVKQAVQAANALQTLARQQGIVLSIGLHTGAVLIRHEETFKCANHRLVMGPAVNLATRLQTQGEAGAILVSKDVYQQTWDAFSFVPMVLTMHGVAQSVTAYFLKS